MRRFTTAAALSAALVAGLVGTSTPASADSSLGVEDVVVTQGTISGSEVLANSGTSYSARQAAAIKKAPCRWYERKQGRRASKKGRWLIWVKVRLQWCYDGSQVISAKAKYNSYTYDRDTWIWRGWGKKQLTHTGSWWSVTARVKGKFYYTGNGRTYKPWATVTGRGDGSYSWWAGS